MANTTLDALIHAVTILFIMSLAVERVAALLKRRDWQPLDFGQRFKKPHKIRVDLRNGRAFLGQKPEREVQLAPNELKGRMFAANAENTLLIGILLAFITGANAFALLPGLDNGFLAGASQDASPILKGISRAAQVFLTGAASGVGSSFWYDLIGLLGEIRRTRSLVETAGRNTDASARPPDTLDVQSPIKSALALQAALSSGADYEELKRAAQAEVPRLEAHYGKDRVKVVEFPRADSDVCIGFQVELDDGARLQATEWPVQVTPSARSYALPLSVKSRK